MKLKDGLFIVGFSHPFVWLYIESSYEKHCLSFQGRLVFVGSKLVSVRRLTSIGTGLFRLQNDIGWSTKEMKRRHKSNMFE